MLTRIVRMSFEPELVEDFLAIFNASKHKIAGFPGCNGVELLRDFDVANVYYTYSKWDGKRDLENYRHSEIFKGVWGKTKPLFNDKPLAYSLKNVES